LFAELFVFELGDRTLIETDRSRIPAALAALERYVIRERVQFADITETLATVTVQGVVAARALGAISPHVGQTLPATSYNILTTTDGDGVGHIIRRDRTGAGGYDLVITANAVGDTTDALRKTAAVDLNAESFQLLRIEARIPIWGSELDESIIPLEADMEDAISYTKGCYVGQEIIARIHSRGHVNRHLRAIAFDGVVAAGSPLVAQTGPKSGETVGRITSSALTDTDSDRSVALGYLHSAYADIGASVVTETGKVGIVVLPATK
jgi:folate-binding protein YgfZ